MEEIILYLLGGERVLHYTVYAIKHFTQENKNVTNVNVTASPNITQASKGASLEQKISTNNGK